MERVLVYLAATNTMYKQNAAPQILFVTFAALCLKTSMVYDVTWCTHILSTGRIHVMFVTRRLRERLTLLITWSCTWVHWTGVVRYTFFRYIIHCILFQSFYILYFKYLILFIFHFQKCGKAFPVKKALKNHMKIHYTEAEKPHVCHICGNR